MKFTLSTTQRNHRGDSLALEISIGDDDQIVGALVFQHVDGSQVELPLEHLGTFDLAIASLRTNLGSILTVAAEASDDAGAAG